MLYQGSIDGFSWFVGVQGKAPLAANGYSLRKSGNAAMDADRPTRRASLWVFRHRVAVLDKGMAIACAPRLAAEHHRDAETINTTLIEH